MAAYLGPSVVCRWRLKYGGVKDKECPPIHRREVHQVQGCFSSGRPMFLAGRPWLPDSVLRCAATSLNIAALDQRCVAPLSMLTRGGYRSRHLVEMSTGTWTYIKVLGEISCGGNRVRHQNAADPTTQTPVLPHARTVNKSALLEWNNPTSIRSFVNPVSGTK
jgi:hypothetical protein